MNEEVHSVSGTDTLAGDTEVFKSTGNMHISLRNSQDNIDENELSTTITSLDHPITTTKMCSPPIELDGLSWPRREISQSLQLAPAEGDNRLQKLVEAVRIIIECIGEDPTREGLRETPERYARAMLYFTSGYKQNVYDLINEAVFNEDHDELVVVKDIDVFSLCEHHMVPFFGKIHVGYIPDCRVLGLSKIARLAEMFSRRLQVQERLTKQLALAISDDIKPQGVGVIMESSHPCMEMRGVQKVASKTLTSYMLGCMRSNKESKEEFLAVLRGK